MDGGLGGHLRSDALCAIPRSKLRLTRRVYLLTPPDPHAAHAHHEDYRMKSSGLSKMYKEVADEPESEDSEADEGSAEDAEESSGDKSMGKDESGTQVAKSASTGPDGSKFKLASEAAAKQSANDDEGFKADPKAHKEQHESAKASKEADE